MQQQQPTFPAQYEGPNAAPSMDYGELARLAQYRKQAYGVDAANNGDACACTATSVPWIQYFLFGSNVFFIVLAMGVIIAYLVKAGKNGSNGGGSLSRVFSFK